VLAAELRNAWLVKFLEGKLGLLCKSQPGLSGDFLRAPTASFKEYITTRGQVLSTHWSLRPQTWRLSSTSLHQSSATLRNGRGHGRGRRRRGEWPDRSGALEVTRLFRPSSFFLLTSLAALAVAVVIFSIHAARVDGSGRSHVLDQPCCAGSLTSQWQ